MTSNGQFSATTLGWVREDLDRHLERLRSQVEHLSSVPGVRDEAVAETAERLDDLRLTLQVLMLQGPVMLATEMSQLCDALAERHVEEREAAFEALLEALVIMPAYLDRLQTGHHDLPLLLMPALNQIRSARNAPGFQESALFAPELDVEIPELEGLEPADDDGESLVALAQRLRQQYERALLDWLNEQDNRELLAPLQGVCETLLHRLRRTDLKRTWWIGSEVLSGLSERKIRNDIHMRRLLARLHLNLKSLSENGEGAVTPESARALSQALLFRAATGKPGHKGLNLLKKRFRLQEMLPDQESLLRARGSVSGKDREMYRSLAAAVSDELTLIKETLDLDSRNGEGDQKRGAACREALLRLADTLRMLGLPELGEAVDALLSRLDEAGDGGVQDLESALLPMAEELLRIEAAVAEQIETLGEPLFSGKTPGFIDLPPNEYRKVEQNVLNEAIRSMHAFQDAIKSRLGGSREEDTFKPVNEVGGALELLGDGQAAALADRLSAVAQSALASVYSVAAIEPERLEWLADAVAALELYLAALRDQQGRRNHLASVLEARLDWLEKGQEESADTGPASEAQPEPPEAGSPSEGSTEPAPPEATISSEAVVMDAELLQVFLEEYEDVSEALQQHLPNWVSRLEDAASLTEVRRCFHTLKGSGRMVGAFELGDFCWQIENMLNALLDTRISTFADAAVTVRLAQATLPALKQRLMGQPSGLNHEVIEAIGRHADALAHGKESDWEDLRARLPGFLAGMLPASRSVSGEPPPQAQTDEVQAVMREELEENLRVVETLLDSVSLDRRTLASADHVRAMHTIAGTLALQPEGREVEVARALEDALETQRERLAPFNNDALWALGSCFAFLQARLDRLEGDEESQSPEDEDSLLGQIADLKAWFQAAEPMEALAESSHEEPQTEAVEREPAEAGPEQIEAQEAAALDDITRIFLEEAREVLGRCDSLLNTWRDNLYAMPLVQNLQREIHTFKGGARMAGLEPLGDLSHAMEELLERTASHELQPTDASVQSLEQGCDQLNAWVEMVSRGQAPDPGDVLESFRARMEELSSGAETVSRPDVVQPAPEPKVFTDIPEVEAPRAGKVDDAPGQAHIRVDAKLLDEMIKSAGEVNIFRARLERQVGNLRGHLGEFNETIARLREQFRKLEMETEAQIRSRYREEPDAEETEFDPLELDRFSSMQQLSRGLSESVADLLNLEELLDDAARQSDTLLNQQSRVSTELQEGLMRTRMVPFGSIAPRLRRLVRTAASETGKKARLKLLMAGSSDLLDRNILEHITVPLEHMLRNAVAHGIEEPADRKKAGKEPEGEIKITVEAEATEFVIRVEDDGTGIDRAAIRQRAVEQGLIDESANPPPAQLFELILGSGFSTSATVTGLAGRGVGMDVVNSEIKQIGGSLEIHSEEGKGSCFTIRIPFSLAVMNAIGVTAGEQRYFIPLASVAGVARVSPAEYQSLLEEEQPEYVFAEQRYPILEFEPLLGEPARGLNHDNVSLLMISSGEQRAAFRVPELLGHREVVIKPVGPQITSVPGILGGTVTGDGRVVIVLDPGPIIRQALMHGVKPVVPERIVHVERRRKVAMVVDDSITMRKVNSRVLDGENFETVTAKDGQDAVEQMQDRIPDILLLDIEMPRMDGYQLAEYVRGDARLRDIPIIMITSRSGKKHRDRAAQAGANAYLTKPYKETELVATVYRLLGVKEP